MLSCLLYFEGLTFDAILLSVPNVEAIDRKAGQVIGEFMEMIFPADYNASGGQKRKVSENSLSINSSYTT